MTDITNQESEVVYKGQIFAGKVTVQAWSIAARLQPNKDNSEERIGLAIAAQIGLNHDQPIPNPNLEYRRKLGKIQQVLDGEI